MISLLAMADFAATAAGHADAAFCDKECQKALAVDYGKSQGVTRACVTRPGRVATN